MCAPSPHLPQNPAISEEKNNLDTVMSKLGVLNLLMTTTIIIHINCHGYSNNNRWKT
jgi:hypothetical protein